MRAVTLMLLGAMLLAGVALAQEVTWQNPLPNGNWLRSPQFPAPDCGYAYTLDLLVRSTDRGRTWEEVGPLPYWTADGSYTTLSFVDCEHGWVGRDSWSSANGYSCEVWRTSDPGGAWTEVSHAGFMKLELLEFISPSEGWMVGRDSLNWPAVLAHTTDGGQTWWRQLELGGYGLDFEMRDSGSGWLSDYDGIRRTTDRGQTWSVVYPSNSWSLSFLDDSLGWAVNSRGLTLYSENGGLDWELRTEQREYIPAPYTLRMLNPGVGLIAGVNGDGGGLFRTADGGVHWQSALTARSFYPTLFNVISVEGYRLFATGYGGIRLISEDAGQTWSEGGTSATYSSIRALDFDGIQGYAVTTGGEILRTRNEGQTWRVVAESGTELEDVGFEGLYGYACGRDVFLRTTDGGDSWDTLSHAEDRVYQALCVSGSRGVWRVVLTYQDTSYTTTIEQNGRYDDEWFTRYTAPIYSYHADIDIVDGTHGWARIGAGGYDSLLHTSDGGLTWEALPSPTLHGIYRHIAAVDSQTVWAGIDDGIWVTHDAGHTWDSVASVLPYGYVNDLSFVTAEMGAVGFHGGRIMVTTNGGATWRYHDMRIYGGSTYVKMLATGEVLVGSLYGSLYSVQFDVGTEDVPDRAAAAPHALTLTAFPNPFNPATSFEIQLSHAEHVQLAVYDLTGRLVETLADQVLTAGPHAFHWNAERYASGLYFARLRSTQTSRTVKIALLR